MTQQIKDKSAVTYHCIDLHRVGTTGLAALPARLLLVSAGRL